jgi:hypothetical protein
MFLIASHYSFNGLSTNSFGGAPLFNLELLLDFTKAFGLEDFLGIAFALEVVEDNHY